MPEPRISVVIPCRNERRHVIPLLDSLSRQELGPWRWEILVADGESDDGTAEALVREARLRDLPLRVLSNPNRIAAAGLNLAIRASRGEFVLRMDAHSEYAPDYVRRCVETLERTGADNAGGPARTRAQGYVARAIQAAYHSPLSSGGSRFHNESYEGWIDTVPYGCWRRATLDRIGLFDADLVRNQDDELNLRLIRAGGRIWQDPQIRSWYWTRSRFGALARQYFQYGFWKVRVVRKHRIPASPRHLAPGAFVLTLLTLLVLGALLRAIGMNWTPPVIALGLLTAVYAAVLIGASIAAAAKRGWDLIPILPLAFATFHWSYGLGFLAGLAFWTARRTGATPGHVFTGLSR
ncbi:MAG: glycosyltransferase family 2 protein [Bryobacteraceae bacterium]|nr:glycosyltransferase family 2 protein [Bryobacteraceae bacterium]